MEIVKRWVCIAFAMWFHVIVDKKIQIFLLQLSLSGDMLPEAHVEHLNSVTGLRTNKAK